MGEKMENGDIKQMIEAEVDKAKSKLPANNLPILQGILDKVILEGMTIKDALKMPQSVIDGYYVRGYNFFNNGKYSEALPIFQFLRLFDSAEPRYNQAIAATFHQMKNYEAAIGNYMISYALDPTNPVPYYHMYDCFRKLGNSLMALNALKAASQICGQNPQHTELKQKIDLEIASIDRG